MRLIIIWIAATFRDLLGIDTPLIYDTGDHYEPDGDWHLWQDYGGES